MQNQNTSSQTSQVTYDMFDRQNFICPISCQIFNTPILASDGFFYEKEQIGLWCENNYSSPITREYITSTFVSCNYFNQLLAEYLSKNPHDISNQYIIYRNHNNNIQEVNTIIENGRFEELYGFKCFEYIIMIESHSIIPLLKCNMPNIILHVIKNLTDFTSATKYGKQLIHYVCQYGLNYVLDFLREVGIDLETQDTSKNRPISYAVRYGQKQMVEYLIHLNVDLHFFNSNSMNLVHMALKYDQADILIYLVDNCVDIDQSNDNDLRPIHIAAKYNNIYMVQLLINKGADIQSNNNEGMTPMKMALKYGNIDVVRLFVQHGVNINTINKQKYKYIYNKIKNNKD